MNKIMIHLDIDDGTMNSPPESITLFQPGTISKSLVNECTHVCDLCSLSYMLMPINKVRTSEKPVYVRIFINAEGYVGVDSHSTQSHANTPRYFLRINFLGIALLTYMFENDPSKRLLEVRNTMC